jgi:hypothetical protein
VTRDLQSLFAEARTELDENVTQARIAFIDKIAAPVADKMFVSGMFP